MTLLPVVARELRVASRRPWNYWGRAVAAAVAVGVSAWILLLERGTPMTRLGAELFAVTAFLSFVFALLAGVIFCADALAAERREGTLGLLFLTDLRGYDVLLGKLAANSLGCVFQLAAALPVMAMSMLLGAVSAGEYTRMILVLLSTLFLSLSVGMFASTLSPDGKRTAVFALGLMVAVCGLIPALGGLAIFFRHKLGWNTSGAEEIWERYCSWASPVPLYGWAFDGGLKGGAEKFWQCLGFVWSVAALSLIWGSLRLPRLWQETALGAKGKGLVPRLEAWRWPSPADRVRFRTRLLEASPLVWLAGRYWSRGLMVWVFLAVVAVALLLLRAEVGVNWFDEAVFFAASLLVHFVFKVWIAAEAPRQFMEDRRSGAMELLVSTPMTVPNLVHGRILAVRRQFEGPALAVLATDVVFMAAGTQWSSGDTLDWVYFCLARMLLFIVDGYALAWTGIWVGMRTRGARSTLPVLFRVLVLPWLIIFGLATLSAVVGRGGGPDFSDRWLRGVVAIWCVIGVITDIFWITKARQNLIRDFREYARSRPGEKKMRVTSA